MKAVIVWTQKFADLVSTNHEKKGERSVVKFHV